MGNRGSGTLDNDGAWDWFNYWHEEAYLYNVLSALGEVIQRNEEACLYPVDCGAALAAAEVLAAWNQQPNSELPDELRQWVAVQKNTVSPLHCALAIRAVQRIRTNSEMQEEWDETDEAESWKAALFDLEVRLQACPG